MAIFNREHEPPEPTEADTAHALAKGLMSIMPGGGELFAWIVTPPLERRRDEWATEMASAVRALEAEKRLKIEDLRDNPAFIDITLQATQAALRTSQAEKREALRNAILNSATGAAPEVDLQHVFVSLVDEFTEWHLRLLKVFADPEAWFGEHKPDVLSRLDRTGRTREMVEQAYPALQTRKDLTELVCADLHTKGLIRVSDSLASGAIVHADARREDALAKATTTLGDEFLQYIDSPVR